MVYSPLDWLYRGSSNHSISRTFYFFVLAAFFLIIIVPTVFVLIYVLLQVREIQSFFMVHPEAGGIMLRALAMSFGVSIFVTIIDLVFGFILAWILAKKNFRGKNLVNTLIESPLAIPTAGLGFSAAVFWSLSPSVNFIPFGSVQIVDNVFLLIVLFHFTTTFPYVVRSLTEILEEIDKNYEIAALACGASKLTVARTITLPLFRSGVATAATLSLAKSLSDTGGVVTLLTTFMGRKLVQSDEIQGTVLIDIWKGLSATDVNYSMALALVSFFMIIFALVLVFLVKFSIRKVNSPTDRVFPDIERNLSRGIYVRFRNGLSYGFIILFVFIPSFFIVAYLLSSPLPQNIDLDPFFGSISLSFVVAIAAIFLNIILGLPIARYITSRNSRIVGILDAIVDIPYLVPSAALGISVSLFWKSKFSPVTFLCTQGICFEIPDLMLVIFAHMAMTFPFIARNVIGGLEEFNVNIEETARTLGARPLQVFLKITLPSIKGAVLAGAVMGFTRSVGETGATLAVSSLKTAPVFIVDQIRNFQNYSLAALTTLILTVITYFFILSSKVILNFSQVRKAVEAFYTGRRTKRLLSPLT